MKGLERSLSRSQDSEARIRTKRVVVTHSFTVDGATGVGDGQVAVDGLPEGNILLLGARANLTFAGPGGDAGLVDAWNGDFSIGSTQDADDTLTGTDANVLASTAVGPAVAEVAPAAEASNATVAYIDNTAGATGLWVNLLVDDVDISADGIAFTVTGEIHVTYVVHGDA